MPTIEQEVRERAYYIWEREGRAFGRAVEHWLRAEAEFCGERQAAAASAPSVVEHASTAAAAVKSPARTLKPRATGSKAALAVSAKAEAAGGSPARKAAKSAAAPKAKADATKDETRIKVAPKSRAVPRAGAGQSTVLH